MLLAVLTLSVVQISGADAAVPEGEVRFLDVAGNDIDSVKSDEQLRVYVRDENLNALGSCTATWTYRPERRIRRCTRSARDAPTTRRRRPIRRSSWVLVRRSKSSCPEADTLLR